VANESGKTGFPHIETVTAGIAALLPLRQVKYRQKIKMQIETIAHLHFLKAYNAIGQK